MSDRIDYWRQIALFPPQSFEEEVHIIGLGNLGSIVAFILTKMGVSKIHLYDSSVVEEADLPNQLFRPEDIGRPKVEAAAEIIEQFTEIKPVCHIEEVKKGAVNFSGIVFLLTEDLSERERIWKECLKLKVRVKMVVSAFLGEATDTILTLNPTNVDNIRLWDRTIKPEISFKGLPAMAKIFKVASFAAWKIIKYFNRDEIESELVLEATPIVAPSPEKLQTPIHIIGLGATGSITAFVLAKMGFSNHIYYDFDNVEDHNLPNQLFRPEDIGRPKVEAAAEIIKQFTGFTPVANNEKVEQSSEFQGIVFLLVDKMDARKEIWDHCIAGQAKIETMIETRLAIDAGRVYKINPSDKDDTQLWINSLCTDEEAEESPCNNRSVMPTVGEVAGIASQKALKHCNQEEAAAELMIGCNPVQVLDPVTF